MIRYMEVYFLSISIVSEYHDVCDKHQNSDEYHECFSGKLVCIQLKDWFRNDVDSCPMLTRNVTEQAMPL